MSARLLACPAVAPGLFLHPHALTAQESRGAITGRVLDAQGALIPGAKVSVTQHCGNERVGG